MKLNLRLPVAAAIAIAVGIIVLAGTLIQHPAFDLLNSLSEIFLLWAVILAAVALLVGVVNLAQVHWNKISTRQPGSAYSTVLILSLLGTTLIAGVFGPTHPWSLWLFNNIQVPAESSLLALLTVVLIFGAARLIGRKMNLFTVVFVGTALLVLLGSASLPGLETSAFIDLRGWIQRVLATAGARGILLGVALGTIATGLRVLMGVDRPYGG